MEDKKMLNDEELENVVGGVDRTYYRLTNAGKVKVNLDLFCCQNPIYYAGSSGKMCCINCKYCDGGYCTNPGFIAEVTNG